jgi:predicted O-methyltransferase YrrM
MVRRAPENRTSLFVEVGTAFGRSAAAMGDFIRQSGKPITFYTCDTFDESHLHQDIADQLAVQRERCGPQPFALIAQAMIAAAGVERFATVSQSASVNYADRFATASLDFVFIDGDHGYQSVLDDIRAWLPKVKDGGWLGGHDIGIPEVRQALADATRLPFVVDNTSWLVWVKRFNRQADYTSL